MSDKFSILPYSIEKLHQIFAEKTKASPQVVSSKMHSLYFANYFDCVKAKTVLVENNYVDRDFLEDFAGYYVRCFADYPRKCTRLHFFNFNFRESDFKKLLVGNTSEVSLESLQQGYLGFIVLKPLPVTIIGRTCLKVYPTAADEPGLSQRYFPAVRSYKANLFGISLSVQTLAFQEQDSVAAACATSALWSTFHATGILFQHLIPSPVEITKAATNNSHFLSRSLPSQGLTVFQIAQAIRGIGLEPLLVQASQEGCLKNNLYAYLRSHVPVLMVIDLYDISEETPYFMGKHAVVVAGYCLDEQNPRKDQSDLVLNAARISKIYAHDDQIGPFARMEFDDLPVSISQGGEQEDLFSISTSWKSRKSKQIGYVRAVPDVVLIPLYHKIRIPFEVIQSLVLYFNTLLETLINEDKTPLSQKLEWDISLITIDEFRKSIMNSKEIDKSLLFELITDNMPRFLWRASAYGEDKIVLELLFDATDIEQGQFFVRAVEYNQALSIFLRTIAQEPSLEKILQERPEWKILEWFRNQAIP